MGQMEKFCLLCHNKKSVGGTCIYICIYIYIYIYYYFLIMKFSGRSGRGRGRFENIVYPYLGGGGVRIAKSVLMYVIKI